MACHCSVTIVCDSGMVWLVTVVCDSVMVWLVSVLLL